MIAFEDYVKIKNNYCLCYFGYCDEYLLLLEALRPKIEQTLPGLNLFFGCKDNVLHLFNNKDKVLPLSELKTLKHQFAHIKEMQFDGKQHPIEQIIDDINLSDTAISKPQLNLTQKAVIFTDGSYPTNPMTIRQIEQARELAIGFDITINGDWRNSGLVLGVESLNLVRAALSGIPTVLFSNGVGTNLYNKMFNLKVIGN